MEEGRAAWPVGVGMITPTSNSNITCHTIHTTPCHVHLLNPVSKVTTTTTAIISTFPLSQPTGASSTEEEASVLGKNTGSMLLLLPPSLHHSLIITSPFPLPRPNGTAATMTAYSRCRSTKSHFTSGSTYYTVQADGSRCKDGETVVGLVRPMRSEVAFRTEK